MGSLVRRKSLIPSRWMPLVSVGILMILGYLLMFPVIRWIVYTQNNDWRGILAFWGTSMLVLGLMVFIAAWLCDDFSLVENPDQPKLIE